MISKKSYFIGSLLFFGILLLVHLFDIRDYYTNESADFDSALFEPALNWGLSFIASSFVLLFVSNVIFQKWLRRIFIWFVPLGLLITFTSRVYGGIPQPGRTDIAGMFGIALVVLTVLFIAWHLFTDWRKQKQLGGKQMS